MSKWEKEWKIFDLSFSCKLVFVEIAYKKELNLVWEWILKP